MVGGLESLVKIHNSSTVTCYWKVSKRHRSSTRRARPEPFLRLLSPGFLHWGEMNTGDVALKTPRAFFQESWKLQEQTLLSFSRVKSLSCVRLFATPRTAARQASLSFTIFWSMFKTHVHRVSDAIQPSHPLSPPTPPAFNLSQHQGLF